MRHADVRVVDDARFDARIAVYLVYRGRAGRKKDE